MSETGQTRFELSKFVLGYLEEVGGVAMPPEFGIYEVLLPAEAAHKLGLDEYLRLAFAGDPQRDTPAVDQAELLHLNISDPLVERIAQALTAQPAHTRSYIPGLRLDKRGLAALARTHYSLPNARLDELPKSQEEATQHHYLLCNFKVTLLSEEKQEELVTVVMDLQAGHAVTEPAILERLAIIDPEPTYTGLPIAPPRWQGAGDALTPATFQALLPRAEAALRQQLSNQLATLTTRMERHLLLDLARIGDYYDEMAADLQRRRDRLPVAEQERRQGFEEKLATLGAEREAKLADARSRYHLRVDLQLLNVLLATQAKISLPVSISNRTVTIQRTIVWDPLTHRLEPLVCEVCGLPGEGLHLCTGGHLAHAECLAPQCVDCKREFCRRCADQISECVVCRRPVCRPSLIKCPTCERNTCSEHRQLCHAADGQPATLATTPTVTPPAPPPVAAQAVATKAPPTPTPATKGKRQPPVAPKAAVKPAPAAKTEPVVKGARLDIQIYTDQPVIAAFVMRSTNRVLATRYFRLTEDGIEVHCECEKTDCPVNGYVYRPTAPAGITKQLLELLTRLQQEYLVPTKKAKFLYMRFGQAEEGKSLVLPPSWLDLERIVAAQRGFDRLK